MFPCLSFVTIAFPPPPKKLSLLNVLQCHIEAGVTVDYISPSVKSMYQCGNWCISQKGKSVVHLMKHNGIMISNQMFKNLPPNIKKPFWATPLKRGVWDFFLLSTTYVLHCLQSCNSSSNCHRGDDWKVYCLVVYFPESVYCHSTHMSVKCHTLCWPVICKYSLYHSADWHSE